MCNFTEPLHSASAQGFLQLWKDAGAAVGMHTTTWSCGAGHPVLNMTLNIPYKYAFQGNNMGKSSN